MHSYCFFMHVDMCEKSYKLLTTPKKTLYNTLMIKCKITVLKRTLNADIAKEYCKKEFAACPRNREGQEFISANFEKPEGFCSWAWCDISKFVIALMTNGNFAEGHYEGWMKDKNTVIACCTDALRPVIFKIERIDD